MRWDDQMVEYLAEKERGALDQRRVESALPRRGGLLREGLRDEQIESGRAPINTQSKIFLARAVRKVLVADWLVILVADWPKNNGWGSSMARSAAAWLVES